MNRCITLLLLSTAINVFSMEDGNVRLPTIKAKMVYQDMENISNGFRCEQGYATSGVTPIFQNAVFYDCEKKTLLRPTKDFALYIYGYSQSYPELYKASLRQGEEDAEFFYFDTKKKFTKNFGTKSLTIVPLEKSSPFPIHTIACNGVIYIDQTISLSFDQTGLSLPLIQGRCLVDPKTGTLTTFPPETVVTLTTNLENPNIVVIDVVKESIKVTYYINCLQQLHIAEKYAALKEFDEKNYLIAVIHDSLAMAQQDVYRLT